MTRFLPAVRLLVLATAVAAAAPLAARDWIVDNSAAPGGDGSASAPLAALAAVQEASAPGDAIVLRPGKGPYAEGLVLKEAQSVVSAEGRAVIANPSGDGIVLAPRTSVTGLTIRTVAGAAIRGEKLGEITLRDLEIAAAGKGEGIVLTGTSGAIAVENVTIDGGQAGVVLDDTSGAVTVTGGTIRNVQHRGISAVKAGALTVKDVRFEKTPAANGTGCGDASPAGEHLKCNAAVHLQDSAYVVLDGLHVQGSAQSAVIADSIRGFTLSNSELNGSGDEGDESGVQLHAVTGEVRITGTRIHDSAARQLAIRSDAGEAKIEIRDCRIGGSKPPHGQQGMLVTAGGDARLALVVDKTAVTGNKSNAIHVIASGTAALDVTVTNGTFRDNAAAVLLVPADASTLAYRIEDNVASGHTSTAINVHVTSKKPASGTIARNTIGEKGKARSGAFCQNGGCGGILVTALQRAVVFAGVNGNTIQQAELGIRVRGGDDSDLRVRINGNTIREPAGENPRPAIEVVGGVRPKETSAVCADIANNTVSGAWNAGGGGAAIQYLRKSPHATLAIAGYAGAVGTPKNAATFVATRNRGAAVNADVTGDLRLADGCPVP
jgi:Right handed beta helix region